MHFTGLVHAKFSTHKKQKCYKIVKFSIPLNLAKSCDNHIAGTCYCDMISHEKESTTPHHEHKNMHLFSNFLKNEAIVSSMFHQFKDCTFDNTGMVV